MCYIVLMPRKGKSGRTKGAVSFVAVSLGALNGVLKPNATVMVSRRYAEQLQLAGEPVAATTKNIESLANQVDLKIENLVEEPETEVKLVVSDLGDEW